MMRVPRGSSGRISVLTLILAFGFASADAAAQPEEQPGTPPPSGQPGTPPGTPSPPVAPEKPKPWAKGVNPEQRAEALKWFTKGNGYFEQSQYPQALAEYRKAIRQWDHPAIRYNMAVCFINLDQPVAGWKNLKRALRFGQGPLSDKLYAQAKTYRKLLKGRLAFVKVVCNEPGAEVTFDGKFMFKAPGEAKRVVLPGAHGVVASKEGFMTQKKTANLFPGKETVIDLKLLPIEDAITTKRRWKRYLPWTVFGSGLGVAAIGVGLILKARSDYIKHDDRYGDQCKEGCVTDPDLVTTEHKLYPQNLLDLKKQAKAEYYSSIVFLAAGGATIAAGITLLVLNIPRRVKVESEDMGPGPGKGTGISIFPAVGPNGGMVVTGFSF